MQSAQMQGAPRATKHKFQAGGGSWPRVNSRARSSDSDTEREYRSNSRSDPSSESRTRNSADSDNHSLPRRSVSAVSADPAPPIPYWSAKRHLTCGNPTADPPWSAKAPAWRGSAPGKLKTANAALVVCLNIDVDPPDVVKTSPCAILECWVDPRTMPSSKALEAIGSNLRCQFEGLSLKIPYKPVLDPCLEDLRKCCQQLRKQAKDDAVLFYYNGHGVPKPTPSGELWCFNRDYTQYIPVSLQEVQGWIGSPGVFIWDSSAAGHLLNNFNSFAEKRDREMGAHAGHRDGLQPMMNSLQLAACAANETLPTCPELPADLFTSCLTSPIDIALRYFVINHHLPSPISTDMLTQLPGDLKDRRTPLGELNWIFAAITDTIAWTTFSRETFTRLYRCDLLISSLFRNFLLAERIMKNYHCTPHTYPPLPATNTHPLWATWDLAVDACLRQLSELLEKKTGPAGTSPNMGSGPGRIDAHNQMSSNISNAPLVNDKPYVYSPSRFFAEQLTAFEVWISRGGSALTRRGPLSLPRHVLERGSDQPEGITNELDSSSERHLVPRKPPDQLPIVLQVLLSQPHRLRALILLSQFVDLGPWAVHLVLTIGIFPYITKLLQAAGQDLRPVLIFIWARILAVDSSVQTDLYNTQGYKYFSNILGIQNEENLPNSSEHKAMCSFILASISRDFPLGQNACWSERVFDHCYDRLEEPDYLLRQWTALCIAQMWDSHNDIKVYGVDRGTQDKLISMLSDDSAEVRSAALYALGIFMGASGSSDPEKQGGGGTGTMFQLEERVHFRMEVAVATGATLAIRDDASPMCRKELLVVISCLVKEWRGYFVVCAWIYWEEDRRWRSGTSGLHHGMASSHFHEEDLTSHAVAEWLESFGDDEQLREENRVLLSSFFTIFVVLLDLSVDPYQEVATNAQTIVDYVMAVLLESPFSRLDSASLHIPPTMPHEKQGSPHASGTRTRVASLQSSPQISHYVPASPGGDRPQISRSSTMNSTISAGVAHTLKRTSSFANALKVLTGSIAFPLSEDGRASPSLASAFLPGQPRVDRQDKMDVSRPPSPNMNVAQYTSPYSRPSSRPPSIKDVPTSPRSTQSSTYGQNHPDFSPLDVMEALFEEDMERLRARRKPGRRSRSPGGSLPSPSNSTFSMDSGTSVILGLGTGSNIRDVLPLKSSYYDWCAEYFKEPQMRQAEPDEPGSVQYNYQVWRQSRNEQVISETSTQAPEGASRSWDFAVSTFSIPGNPLTMTFHSYDQHLVIANESDMISVWDWHKRKRLNYFCNGNPKGTSITALQMINEDVGGIILSGSADGIVRLYRNYDPTVEQGPLQMVSGFRALNEMILLRQGSGLVMDWKQSAGILLVGGDSHVIKVWDAQTETQGLDIDTNSKSPVTSIMSSMNGSSQTFVASFGDGGVKVFDRRLDDDDAVVRSYNEHTSWIQKACWDPRLDGQIVSASLDGEVKLFDVRGSDNAAETWYPHSGGLSAFDMHPQAGVWATTSAVTPSSWRAQKVTVQGFKDPSTNKASLLSSFNVSTGLTSFPMRPLPSPFIPRASSLVFHPMEMVYGLGMPDGTVRILGCKLNEPLDKL
ncbi:hypothetical protein CPB83DRAFT_842046 [Crepidotus variabilis]|uniref:Raptor N-terminal CASPase-like domain-containing protein n=1 Tax=Crepidotus variabilis TaxID=179855 RepID=A0A9P6JX66_9AGAR|nr:hypothetical protein CPB83DRAFT_842046 [Crepidotus variabilis]